MKKINQQLKLPATSYKLQASRAFTLIEILVASAIFTAIVVLSIGSFTGSINYQGTSTEDRITRQSISDFNDWMTRQIRSVASSKINIPIDNHCLVNDVTNDPVTCIVTPATEDYRGFGFLLFHSFAYSGGGYYKIAYPATASGVNNLILPRSGGGWIYISGNKCVAEDTLPVIRMSKSRTATDLDTSDVCKDDKWDNAGQVLSSDVVVKSLTFYGINPSSLFKANVNSSTYPALSQPFVTWRIQVAPAGDPTNVSSYQTTLTSRDYSYIYPSVGN